MCLKGRGNPIYIYTTSINHKVFISFEHRNFLRIFSFSQTPFEIEKRDHIWLTGYGSNPDIIWVRGTRIDFNYDPPLIEYQYRNTNFDIINASICNTNGSLQFYTNGIVVVDLEDELLENGSGLNPDPFRVDWVSKGYPLYQGALILPLPSDTQRVYSIFHEEYFKKRALEKLQAIKLIHPNENCKLIYINVFGDCSRPKKYLDSALDDVENDFDNAEIIVLQSLVRRESPNEYCKEFIQFLNHLKKTIEYK